MSRPIYYFTICITILHLPSTVQSKACLSVEDMGRSGEGDQGLSQAHALHTITATVFVTRTQACIKQTPRVVAAGLHQLKINAR